MLNAAELLIQQKKFHKIHNKRACVFYSMGIYCLAITDIKKAIKLSPKPEIEYFIKQAQMLKEEKRYDEALDIVVKVTGLDKKGTYKVCFVISSLCFRACRKLKFFLQISFLLNHAMYGLWCLSAPISVTDFQMTFLK